MSESKSLLILLVAYAFCSSTLLILNKVALQTINSGTFLLLLQCVFTCMALGTLDHFGFTSAISPLEAAERERFTVVVALFVTTLFANMKCLQLANVDTVICIRMTCPLLVSLLDYLFLGRELPTRTSTLALVATCVSFASFLLVEQNSSWITIFWLSFWYCAMVFETVFVKFVVSDSSLSTAAQSFYQNLLAIPVLTVIWFSTEIPTSVFEQISLSTSEFSLVLSTCILGLGMSYLSFAVRERVSATSFSMLGNTCKLITILTNYLLWEKHATGVGTFAVLFCLASSTFYRQAPLRHPINHKAQSWFPAPCTIKATEEVNMRIIAAGLLGILALGLHFTSYFRSSVNWNLEEQTGVSGVSGKLFTGAQVRQYFPSHDDRPSKKNRSTSSPFFSDHMSCENWAVCTTIFVESDAVRDVCKILPSYCLLVVADKKGPLEYFIDGNCTFAYLSVEQQEDMLTDSDFITETPWNHFGRKNLGYLFAIANGAKMIWDFDDDNQIISSKFFLDQAGEHQLVTVEPITSMLNPYPLLGAEKFSWPRGFPLDGIKNEASQPSVDDLRVSVVDFERVGVLQSLANNDPDVDAIYRLQRDLPFSFKGWSSPASVFVLPGASFAPWNAQATLFRMRDALWVSYLPISIHGRVSDIWRSYIAQRLLRNVCIHIAFAVEPLVVQHRNQHSYLADFDAEQDLYYKSGKLIELLGEWTAKSSFPQEQIVELFRILYEHDYVGIKDVRMIELWISELNRAGYIFPKSCSVR